MIMAARARRSYRSSFIGSEVNIHDLLSAVTGIIFLGTPSKISPLFNPLVEVKLFQSRKTQIPHNGRLITIPRVDSQTLSELQANFERERPDTRLASIKLVYYWETIRVQHPWNMVLVDQKSAMMHGAQGRSMTASHMDIHTFHEGDILSKVEDIDYRMLRSDLQKIFHSSATTVRRRFESGIYMSPGQDETRERLYRWLNPSLMQPTILARNLAAQEVVPYSCQWIYEQSDYRLWCKGVQRAIWITGKPGSGKTILASSIIKNLRNGNIADPLSEERPCENSLDIGSCNRTSCLPPVLYYFCGIDRKSDTPDRMLATLIHQILCLRPRDPDLFQKAMMLYHNTNLERASQDELARTLGVMIAMLGPV
jgi:hypothetical protein